MSRFFFSDLCDGVQLKNLLLTIFLILKQRSYWMTGATLMGIVVVKLFLIELSNSGGIALIVSFIIVGLLLLLVGWFAPVPPKAENDGEPKA
ncbi:MULTISPECIES: DUF2339 domain-containing protein [unclassified Neisseria]|uniref:DUF2339 domain-containing protein n=1 Tax=unclassified Neisseria TaxID=2623750 RepID=UPI0024B0D249|nr:MULTISPECIES: DUF2339 domain-containing protein [unclassified Neisseria]